MSPHAEAPSPAPRRNLPLGWVLGGFLGMLLGLELLLRLLPVSSATYVDYYLSPNIRSYPPHFEWTAATGWDLRNAQTQYTNNAGFVGRRDLSRDPRAIALIGDSYVEASMLPSSQRPSEQLERALGDTPVFALGMPGSALLDYAERMHWAQRQYGLRRFVLLLEGGDLRQSLCGSGQIHGPCLDPKSFEPRQELKPAPDPLKRILRHSALALYLTGQLQLDASRLWRQALLQARAPVEGSPRPAADTAPRPATTPEPKPSAGAQAVTAAFLARIQDLQLDTLLIVIDARRPAIYADTPAVDPDMDAFAKALRERGAQVIRGEEVLVPHYRSHGLKFEVGPYDAHLNGLGVQLLMESAAARLKAGKASPS